MLSASVRFIARRISNYSTKLLLKRSGIFDPVWYGRTYPDTLTSDLDPLSHYVHHGASEGRDPSPFFDTAFYLKQFKNLDPARVNPLGHYLAVGERLGAWPNRLFNPNFLHDCVLPKRGKSLLFAFISNYQPGLSTCADFNANEYVESYPHLQSVGVHPLRHALARPDETNLSVQATIENPDLEISKINQLDLIDDRAYQFVFQVTGDDPFIELSKENGQAIQSGHFRLSVRFLGDLEILTDAKCYYDFGTGYSEDASSRLFFSESNDGRIFADISLPDGVKAIRIDPTSSFGSGDKKFGLSGIEFRKLERNRFYYHALSQVYSLRSEPIKFTAILGRELLLKGPRGITECIRNERNSLLGQAAAPVTAHASYQAWIDAHDTLSAEDIDAMRASISAFPQAPKISIVMPVYNTPETLLRECIDSVLNQVYENWQLCIADDLSTAPHVRSVLEEYANEDSRISVVFRKQNGHISAASNSALKLASGDWIALLDHDDTLPVHALYCVAESIISNPDGRLFYSDEDKIDESGKRLEPFFKPDWNERLFYEQNFISHLGVYRRDIIEQIGGFREGFEGAQDHDLALRFIQEISPDQIIHIPIILYHWRILKGSTAMGSGEKSYALTASEKAIEEALQTRQKDASVRPLKQFGYVKVRYDQPRQKPLVSIIVPTRDGLDVLKPCIDSVLKKTEYDNFEIIIVDNQSEKRETLDYFEAVSEDQRVKVLNYDHAFNYSAINNFAVSRSNGDYVCLLNNDTEVISEHWLGEMVAELSQEGVGAVGAKLLYSDRTVQHGGVILGVGGENGVAGHALLGIDDRALGYFCNNQLTREVSAATAACMLTKREVFDEVGGLNEKNLTVAFNDIDLCLKIRSKNYKIIWTPEAVLFHYESKSRGLETTPEKQARFLREVNYMLTTWGDTLKHDPYYNPNLALDADSYDIARLPRNQKPWSRVF